MTLRDKMIVLRDKAGISQMALAEQLGVSRQAVTRWESGDTTPSMDKLKALAKIYDDFNLGSGGSKTYNGKTENALWYPGDGSGTWSIYVNGNSNTSVSSAKLYYIRSFNTDVAVKTMSSIDRGSSDSESFVGIDGKTYYAVITAKTNEGVYGTTNLSQ